MDDLRSLEVQNLVGKLVAKFSCNGRLTNVAEPLMVTIVFCRSLPINTLMDQLALVSMRDARLDQKALLLTRTTSQGISFTEPQYHLLYQPLLSKILPATYCHRLQRTSQEVNSSSRTPVRFTPRMKVHTAVLERSEASSLQSTLYTVSQYSKQLATPNCCIIVSTTSPYCS